MNEPSDRIGIFLVAARYHRELQEEAARVAELEFPGDGSVAPPQWRVAVHELFERLLKVAVTHRVLSIDVLDELAIFTSSVDKRNRRAWDEASPARRLELVKARLEGGRRRRCMRRSQMYFPAMRIPRPVFG
jgi:hypothetical protein